MDNVYLRFYGLLSIKNIISFDDYLEYTFYAYKHQPSFSSWVKDNSLKYYFEVTESKLVDKIKGFTENKVYHIKDIISLKKGFSLILYEK